ncbi:hypothetical protein [Streptomyces sp. NPDC051909]|uniref:hypothetical protein n=1 Tax=Streptomyces sp. NPDC051909 TaxID=3154944 RepID=UPI003424FEF7
MLIVTDPPTWSGGARWAITYVYFGSTSKTRYVASIGEAEAHQVIGANVVAGFEPVVFTHDATDRQLRTPSGEQMKVMTLNGLVGVVSALVFVRSSGREHPEPAVVEARRALPQVSALAPRGEAATCPVRGADELRVHAYLGRLGVAL